MCGRYSRTAGGEIVKARFGADILNAALAPASHIAPSAPGAVVWHDGTHTVLDEMRWGLVPSWTKEPQGGLRPINARSETAAQNGMFRSLLARRRCLLPADGFYEWRSAGKSRQPYRIQLQGGEPFAFAGLWDTWQDPTREDAELLYTCTILTVDANELVRPIHDRMPVILPRELEAQWLAPERRSKEHVLPMLQPLPSERLELYPVSPRVNDVRFQGPECLARVMGQLELIG